MAGLGTGFSGRSASPPRMGGRRFGQVGQAKGELLVSHVEQRAGLSSSSGPSSSSRPILILPAHPHPPLPRTGCLSSEKVSCTSSVALKRNCSLRRETLVFRYFSLIGVFACDILRYRTFGFGAGSPAKLPQWEGWGLDTASQFRLTQSWSWALLCSQLGKSCKQEGQTMKILGFFLSVA